MIINCNTYCLFRFINTSGRFLLFHYLFFIHSRFFYNNSIPNFCSTIFFRSELRSDFLPTFSSPSSSMKRLSTRSQQFLCFPSSVHFTSIELAIILRIKLYYYLCYCIILIYSPYSGLFTVLQSNSHHQRVLCSEH